MCESGSPVSPNLVRPEVTTCEEKVQIEAASAEREIGQECIDGLGGNTEVEDDVVRILIAAPRPKAPIQAEIAAHEPLHLEY